MYTRTPLPRGFPSFFLFYEVMEEKWQRLVTTAEQKTK